MPSVVYDDHQHRARDEWNILLDLGYIDTWAYHVDLRHLDWGPNINNPCRFPHYRNLSRTYTYITQNI